MRRLPLILGLALVVVLTIWEVYDFVVTNEGVRYFSSEPRRLAYVMILGLTGGLVAFGISRQSPGSQRTLMLTALGTFGVLLLGVLGLFAYHLTRAASIVSEAGMWGWMAAAIVSVAVLAGLVWFEFHQKWRRA